MKCPKCLSENTQDSRFCKNCASALPVSSKTSLSHTQTLETPLQELSRGNLVAGRYEIIEELGRGGMGSVYRVYDRQIAGEVALKLIRPEIAADKKTIERFRNELKITRMITHKNVCRMFDIGDDKGTHFITMEYIPGEDLKSMIRMGGQLSVGTAIKIATQVCEGLAEAHRLGIVHRDLKPSNIIIDKNGDARIMDFGIARSLEAKGITGQGMMIGTPEYISPEQVDGKETDPRSDIYSLGVTFYEMVTGNLPFEGGTPISLAIKHKSEPAPDPRRHNDQIPQSLSRLISRCLAKDKNKRFQTADELLTGLKEIEKEIPTRELRRSPGKPFSKPFLSKLRKKKIIEIIAAFIAGGGFLLEFVHWTLIDHYHLPERIFDVTLVTLIGTLIFILIWRWFEGKESPRKFKKELILLPLVALLTILIDVNLVLRLKPPESGPFRTPEPAVFSEGGRKSIAVMLAVNNSGAKELNHFRIEIAELMAIALSQSKYLRVFPLDSVMNILEEMKMEDLNQHSSKILARVAKEGNIEYFVLPSFSITGENFWISITIRKAVAREIEGGETAQSKGTEGMQMMVDELARKVKTKFDLTAAEIANDYEQNVGKIATSSLEALRLYIDGKRSYIKGRYKESIEILEKAVAIDPEFALAYKKIAEAYSYLGSPDLARKYIQKALSLADRVSERERCLIQAHLYTIDDSPREAIASYQKLLSLYPNDEDGMVLLGSLYRNLEEWDLAAEQFEKTLQINPKSELIFENLAFIYMSEGRYDRAETLLEANEHLFPEVTAFPYFLSLIFLNQNNFDRALQELNKMVSMAPESTGALEHMGDIYSIKGEYDVAKKIYLQLLAKDDPEAQRRGRAGMILLDLTRGELKKCSQEISLSIELAQKTKNDLAVFDLRLVQAYIDLQSGRFAEAAETSNLVAKTAPDLYIKKCALHYQGIAFLGMNRIEDAKKTAQQLGQLIERSAFPKHKRRFYHLMGCIAAKGGIPTEAIKYFEAAIALLPQQVDIYDEHAFYLDPLARAHYDNGNLEKAQEQYEKIVSLTTGRLSWGDIYARSLYWLGKIQQKKGSRAKAAEYYQRFLSLWENADHTFPEKEDAKRQLALLK